MTQMRGRDQLLAAAASPTVLNWYRYPMAAMSSMPTNLRLSTFSATTSNTGSLPPANPMTTAGIMTSASVGAPVMPVALKPGNSWYLAGVTVTGQYPYGLTLLDRYWQGAPISLSATTGSIAAGGAGAFYPARAGTDYAAAALFLELTTINTSGTTVSIAYTNGSGAGRTATTTSISSPSYNGPGFTAGPVQLAEGDTSISALTGWNLVSGSSGTMVPVLAKPLLHIPVQRGVPDTRLSWIDTGLIDLGTDPCLYWLIPTRGSSEAQTWIEASVTLVQG